MNALSNLFRSRMLVVLFAAGLPFSQTPEKRFGGAEHSPLQASNGSFGFVSSAVDGTRREVVFLAEMDWCTPSSHPPNGAFTPSHETRRTAVTAVLLDAFTGIGGIGRKVFAINNQDNNAVQQGENSPTLLQTEQSTSTSEPKSTSGEHPTPRSAADVVYQYSLLEALRNGVYEGELTVAAAKRHGLHMLGTFNFLNGELVADGKTVYQVLTSGKVVEAADSAKLPYVMATRFWPDLTVKLPEFENYQALCESILNRLPSKNIPYAIRVDARFVRLELGGAEKVKRDDHRPLTEVIADRPRYQASDVSGTIVGFYVPNYLANVAVANFHFHFISADHKLGGHFLDGHAVRATVSIDAKETLRIDFPKDNAGYRRAWKSSGNPKKGY